jgi:hypothetical protein
MKLAVLIFFTVALAPAACQPARDSTRAAGLPVASPETTTIPDRRSEGGSPEASRDACALLTDGEVASAQGSPLKARNAGVISRRGYRTSQCVYQTEDVNRGISLSVTQADPDDPQRYSVRVLWAKMFPGQSRGRKDRGDEEDSRGAPEAGEEEEDEPAVAPRKIKGLGGEAYWVASQFGGALYVLKGERIIRVSVGGRDDPATKLRKSSALARLAASRL